MPYATKCFSLPGRAGSINGWFFPGNREYIITAARCHWVRLWINWSDVDLDPVPSDVYAQWARYNSHPVFNDLDGWIADATANGVSVLLSCSQYYPTWANDAPKDANGNPKPQSGTNKDPRTRFPSNLELGSPWERFLTYCHLRYRGQFDGTSWSGLYNPSGPRADQPYGNPQSARIAAFGIMNEPNFEAWQDYEPGCTAAKMMQTIDSAASFWNGSPGSPPAFFAPDSSDCGDKFVGSVRDTTDIKKMTTQTLDQLANWRPVNYWAWAVHNYQDVKDGTDTRLDYVHTKLGEKNWRGGGDRYIYVTESGWSLKDVGYGTTSEQTQRNKVVNHWAINRGADYRMGTQHLLRNDLPRTNIVEQGIIGERALPLYSDFQQLAPRRP